MNKSKQSSKDIILDKLRKIFQKYHPSYRKPDRSSEKYLFSWEYVFENDNIPMYLTVQGSNWDNKIILDGFYHQFEGWVKANIKRFEKQKELMDKQLEIQKKSYEPDKPSKDL